jgi:predicted metal-dependent phosphoesterase TrpH
MNVDLHTHTHPASTCSHISVLDYISHCVENGIEAIAVTNHGDVSDNNRIEEALSNKGIVVVHGVEISTLFGDFVIYSPDLEYLATFKDVQDVPSPGSIHKDVAVVWVHPAAGGGRSASAYYPSLEQLVAPLVDAVELFNGNWLGESYVETTRRIAAAIDKPCTGGSDAHFADRIMACSTEIAGDVRSTADVVTAIKDRAVTPHARAQSRKPHRRLFGR